MAFRGCPQVYLGPWRIVIVPWYICLSYQSSRPTSHGYHLSVLPLALTSGPARAGSEGSSLDWASKSASQLHLSEGAAYPLPIPRLQLGRAKGEHGHSRPRQQISWSTHPVYPGSAASCERVNCLLVHRDILGLHCLLVAAAVAVARASQPHVCRLWFYGSMCTHAVCHPVLSERSAFVPLRRMEGSVGLRL